MAKYEWITVELYDPTSLKDYDKLNMLFFYNSDFSSHIDYSMNSPFVFLIYKYEEIKDSFYSKEKIPIGYIFLHQENLDNPVCDVYFGIDHKYRRKGYLNWALDILNYKIEGFSLEEEEWKKEYEKFMTDYTYIVHIPNRSFLKSCMERNSVESTDPFSYRLGLPCEKIKKLRGEI